MQIPDLTQWSNSLRIRRTAASQQVFDPVRKRWVALSPEEFVRQLLIMFFAEAMQFPLSRMSVEKKLVVYHIARRYDVVLYDRQAQPLLLAECKAPAIHLDQKVIDQAALYNIQLRVPYLMMTNGRQSLCCQIDFEQQRWAFLDEMPSLID